MTEITVREVFEHHYGKLTDEMICGILIEEGKTGVLLTPVIYDFRTDYDTPCSMLKIIHGLRTVCIVFTTKFNTCFFPTRGIQIVFPCFTI